MHLSTIWLIAAACIVICLAVYAVVLWLKVFQQRKAADVLAEQEAARKEHLIDSIRLIARAGVQDQANITECAIRVKVLMDNLYQNQCPRDEFRPIYELAWATAHMPIREQREAFSKKEIRQFDREREALEEKMGEGVKQALQKLDDFDFFSD